MDTDMLPILLSWFTSSLVTGLCGLGGALLAIPVMLFVMPMHDAILVSCITSLPLVCCMGLWYMRQCRKDVLLQLIAGVIPGSFLGLHLLQFLPDSVLQACLGVMTIGFIVFLHFGEQRLRFRERPAATVLVGFLAGAIGTAICVDGPVIGMYGLMAAWPPPVFLGITSGFFLCRSIVTVFLQWQAGLYTPGIVHYTLYSIPAGLLGFAVSIPLVKRLPVQRFRDMVKFVLVIAGVSCLINAF